MSHKPEEVIVILSVATSQADAMEVGNPRVWYCSQLLGERFVVVVQEDIARTSPTWPGDLITSDEQEAATWLGRPSDQAELGRPPDIVDNAEPTTEEIAVSETTHLRIHGVVVGIDWWVSHVRAFGSDQFDEVKRTPRHRFVHVRPLTNTAADTIRFEFGFYPCDCGISLGSLMTECPDGIGCTLEDD